MIGSFAQLVIYEGISTLCFACGRVGHRKDSCPYLIKNPSMEEVTPSSPPPPHSPPCQETHPEEAYGLWILVDHRRNKLKPNISKPIANHKSKAQFPINQYRDTLPNQPHRSPIVDLMIARGKAILPNLM